MKSHSVDVLVVGAGPVGLFTALRLAQEGLSVHVIERASGPIHHSYALALHPASLRLLDRAGLGDSARRAGQPIQAIALYDEEGRRRATVQPAVVGVGSGLYALPQAELERLLLAALDLAGVPVLWNHRMANIQPDDEGVTVRIDQLSQRLTGYACAHLEWIADHTIERRCRYVVGADGHHSLIRHRLGFTFPEVAPAESYAVFEFLGRGLAEAEMRMVLGPDSTHAVWPLPGGGLRWSFQIPTEEADRFSRQKDLLVVQHGSAGYPLLEASYLHEMLTRHAPWFDPHRVGELRWRLAVRFERRLTTGYGRGRVWLAGDAAHLTSPAGVQSMNIGLREGDDLAMRLAEAIHHPASTSLDSYGAHWMAEWQGLLGLADPWPTTGADGWIASMAPRLRSCLPASGPDLDAFAGALGLPVGTTV